MSRRKKIGLAPGSMVYTGTKNNHNTYINCIEYNQEHVGLRNVQHIDELDIKPDNKYWIDVCGIHDVSMIQRIGDRFNINRLAIEDILDPSLRPKIEDYDEGFFCIIKSIRYNRESKSIVKEQISLFMLDRVLISFQEDTEDSFEPIRKRMDLSNSRTRTRDVDYLFYSIMDYIVDKYYEVIDAIQVEIEEMEEMTQLKLHDDIFIEQHELRTKLIQMKRYVLPLREEISKIQKFEYPLIQDSSLIYFRDLEDHIVQIVEAIDNQRELLISIKEVSLNQISFDQNKDMKWLAAVSTISIPILFLTGVYGMNFKFMPELEWRYGYLLWWITTITVMCTVILYFRRKNIF